MNDLAPGRARRSRALGRASTIRANARILGWQAEREGRATRPTADALWLLLCLGDPHTAMIGHCFPSFKLCIQSSMLYGAGGGLSHSLARRCARVRGVWADGSSGERPVRVELRTAGDGLSPTVVDLPPLSPTHISTAVAVTGALNKAHVPVRSVPAARISVRAISLI